MSFAVPTKTDRFPIMKPLITLMYPSHLLHKDGVIMSEVGNSSSTIFCVAAAPAIKSTSPHVDVHAIMDDISLTGDPQELSFAVPVMITELAKVGLRINLKKSVVLNCPELASRLGIPAVDGAKILGAWIGDDEKCEEFLNKQLNKCKPFFALTAKLAPEIALPVLSRCGAVFHEATTYRSLPLTSTT
ncbi:Hypothetical protein, putative [Bodo saltans]|uniref:Reverse transcriptase domain-containing protein n=1 Tax=Bodo saltans TaxID=75058 RepID=A0A0S4JMQ3_BODSA|nr:Hypothetical protein, putative [Bodo saltans]|eukprot:CUG91520.1 Hypothetical protein, putative [Bodo saltans]